MVAFDLVFPALNTLRLKVSKPWNKLPVKDTRNHRLKLMFSSREEGRDTSSLRPGCSKPQKFAM